ncbi:MAG: polysaccharide pyruvyl transferase family protein, partial [Candidatus Omnitrophica bacterium]|nr:polysaccharide pyruvyl transferase family protein [Candidatus Omnitrophota bacterium]
ENHGDEALIWIIRDLLAPEIDVKIGCEEFDIALLGGGTLINQSPWLIDEFASHLDRARLGVVFGTGVGDLAFWGNHFDRWRPLLNRCGFVGVRGPHSQSLLMDHEVEKGQVVGDPYLWLKSPVERDPIPKRLCVNIGRTNDSLWGGTDRDLLDFIAAALLQLKGEGWSFYWISVWGKDIDFVQELRQRVDPHSNPILDARDQPLETFSALAGSELFLGEKLHANAMAAVAGTPFVAVEYQPKVRDFAASLGMEDWVVSTAERDGGSLLNQIHSLRAMRDSAQSKMIENRNNLRNRLIQFSKEIKVEVFHLEEDGP